VSAWLLLSLACARDPVLQLPRADATLVKIAEGMPQITDLQPVPGSKRAVVLGKQGTAWLLDPSTGATQEWLTVSVRSNSEMGLLGLAFAPDFATSGTFYLSTNPADGEPRSEISRWRCDPATLASPSRVDTVLQVAQPYANHDGGQIRFGPDGMLYIGLGDGGSANDPLGAGQDLGTWLGSLLRIDVSKAPYAVPADNPFVGRPDAKPEIWAWGLRNPWRFDMLPDGRVIIGDVGQNQVEEITVATSGSNHGWNRWEGDRCFAGPCTDGDGTTAPLFTYTHAVGSSVTGGVVPKKGPYAGDYVFGDFVSGRLWRLDLSTGKATDLGKHDLNVSTFGHAPDGEVWVADYGGTVYRLSTSTSSPPSSPPTPSAE
jgi:glucose/arabinose dehydrogenase